MSKTKTEIGNTSEKKRKRSNENEEEELEIDVNLPEPPSKKAARKERKAAGKLPQQSSKKDGESREKQPDPELTPAIASDLAKAYFNSDAQPQPAKRSEYGIWIGNMPFTVTRDSLREWLDREGRIEGKDIVRLHMPTNDKDRKNPRNKEPFNRGFAYVDFTSKDVMEAAIGLSEKLLAGRRVLIKDAKSFEGRPQKVEQSEKKNVKAPSKRVFVGNLGFDVTKDDLMEHFGQAGEVEDIFLATFEDTGKCKGFGWVRFAELEAAQAAVKGFIFKEPDDDDAGDDAAAENGDAQEGQSKTKKKKKQKWFINRLYGRVLRCEFAEDAQTRYKKRYGKDASKPQPQSGQQPTTESHGDDSVAADAQLASLAQEAGAAREKRPDKDQRREERRKKHEKMDGNRMPEKVSQREKGAAVAGSGTKISFD